MTLNSETLASYPLPRQRLAGLLACIFFVVICTSSQANDSYTLTLNTAAEPPLSTEFQNGFIDLVVKEALTRIGMTLHTVRLPAERALQDSNAGIIDGEIIRVAGLEQTYANLIAVPEKLMDLEFMAFSRKPVDLQTGWDALAGHSIAFINGWKILEHNTPREAEVTKVQTQSQLFNLLSLDRVDIVIYERWGGSHLLKAFNLSQARPILPPLAVRSMHIYLHRKHQPLVEKLDRALKDMKADGTYQKIYNDILRLYQDQ